MIKRIRSNRWYPVIEMLDKATTSLVGMIVPSG